MCALKTLVLTMLTISPSLSIRYNEDDQDHFNVNWKLSNLSSSKDGDSQGGIAFQVSMPNSKWIGIGFTGNGMSDVYVGYISASGTPKLLDMYSDNSYGKLLLDKQQSVGDFKVFIDSNGLLGLEFSRDIDTSDPNDLPLNIDDLDLIWAYGKSLEEVENLEFDLELFFGKKRIGSFLDCQGDERKRSNIKRGGLRSKQSPIGLNHDEDEEDQELDSQDDEDDGKSGNIKRGGLRSKQVPIGLDEDDYDIDDDWKRLGKDQEQQNEDEEDNELDHRPPPHPHHHHHPPPHHHHRHHRHRHHRHHHRMHRHRRTRFDHNRRKGQSELQRYENEFIGNDDDAMIQSRDNDEMQFDSKQSFFQRLIRFIKGGDHNDEEKNDDDSDSTTFPEKRNNMKKPRQ